MSKSAAPTPEQRLDDLVATIYDAAVAPERWSDVLERLRLLFGLSFGAMVTRNADRTQVEWVAVGVDQDDYREFHRKYFRTSVYAAYTKKWYAGEIIEGSKIAPPKVVRRSEMYQEYLGPRDMHEGLRLGLALDEAGNYQVMSLMRSWSAGRFTPTEIGYAQTLMPHLRRAVALGQRLRRADMLASAALSTLDVLRHAVLLLDETGRVLHANAAAERLIAAGEGLAVCQGALQGATPEVTRKLQGALARASGLGAQAGALRLPRPGGGALAVLVMPFRQETGWALSRRPAILVSVTDPAAAVAISGQQLTALFGLSGKEAALAGELMAGRELREIAERSHRSINTVRTHLARLMAKTDVNRQSELMRLLSSLPRTDRPI